MVENYSVLSFELHKRIPCGIQDIPVDKIARGELKFRDEKQSKLWQ